MSGGGGVAVGDTEEDAEEDAEGDAEEDAGLEPVVALLRGGVLLRGAVMFDGLLEDEELLLGSFKACIAFLAVLRA